MSISVVIPAHNEEGCIEATVTALDARWREAGEDVEIIVVDDGSTDDTLGRAERAATGDVKVLTKENGGKGSALVAGVAASRGDVVYFIDADLPYSFADQRSVVAAVRDGSDVAIGSRRIAGATAEGYPLLRRVLSRGLLVLMRVVLGIRVTDSQCGLKAFDGEVARRLFDQVTISGFGVDLELLFRAQRQGLAIVERPVTLTHSLDSSVHLLGDSVAVLRNVVGLRWRALTGGL